ncbi:Dynein Heavy Chain 14, Axonemal [Manis pentadactyla]|nr:Dynein Heavy Chain 14, Axonemal [Manis pentadactyla]
MKGKREKEMVDQLSLDAKRKPVTGLLEFMDCNKELGYGNLLPGASFTGCLYLQIIAATYVDDNAHAYKEKEILMEKLKKDSQSVKKVQILVKQEEEIMAEKVRIVEDYAQKAANELKSVLPAIDKKTVALSALGKADVAELRLDRKAMVMYKHLTCGSKNKKTVFMALRLVLVQLAGIWGL